MSEPTAAAVASRFRSRSASPDPKRRNKSRSRSQRRRSLRLRGHAPQHAGMTFQRNENTHHSRELLPDCGESDSDAEKGEVECSVISESGRKCTVAAYPLTITEKSTKEAEAYNGDDKEAPHPGTKVEVPRCLRHWRYYNDRCVICGSEPSQASLGIRKDLRSNGSWGEDLPYLRCSKHA